MAGLELIAAFVLAFAVSLLVYAFGRGLSGKSGEKLEPYACGESLPDEELRARVHVYWYAVLFLVFDIVAVMFAMTKGLSVAWSASASLVLVLAYSALVAIALLVLRGGRGWM